MMRDSTAVILQVLSTIYPVTVVTHTSVIAILTLKEEAAMNLLQLVTENMVCVATVSNNIHPF